MTKEWFEREVKPEEGLDVSAANPMLDMNCSGEITVDTRHWMTHLCAPESLIAEHGWKRGALAHVPTCPVCSERCRINIADHYALFRLHQRCEIPAGTGPAVSVAPDDGQSVGIYVPLVCQNGHSFDLAIMQTLRDTAVHFDVFVPDETYETHPELFGNVVEIDAQEAEIRELRAQFRNVVRMLLPLSFALKDGVDAWYYRCRQCQGHSPGVGLKDKARFQDVEHQSHCGVMRAARDSGLAFGCTETKSGLHGDPKHNGRCEFCSLKLLK